VISEQHQTPNNVDAAKHAAPANAIKPESKVADAKAPLDNPAAANGPVSENDPTEPARVSDTQQLMEGGGDAKAPVAAPIDLIASADLEGNSQLRNAVAASASAPVNTSTGVNDSIDDPEPESPASSSLSVSDTNSSGTNSPMAVRVQSQVAPVNSNSPARYPLAGTRSESCLAPSKPSPADSEPSPPFSSLPSSSSQSFLFTTPTSTPSATPSISAPNSQNVSQDSTSVCQ
jgi:hypothetical protein